MQCTMTSGAAAPVGESCKCVWDCLGFARTRVGRSRGWATVAASMRLVLRSSLGWVRGLRCCCGVAASCGSTLAGPTPLRPAGFLPARQWKFRRGMGLVIAGLRPAGFAKPPASMPAPVTRKHQRSRGFLPRRLTCRRLRDRRGLRFVGCMQCTMTSGAALLLERRANAPGIDWGGARTRVGWSRGCSAVAASMRLGLRSSLGWCAA